STKTYTLTVTRAAAANAGLASLVPSAGPLTPAFTSGATSYSASVSSATTSVTVTPTVAQANATVKVNGISVPSGSASPAINLAVGPNTITTVVTARGGGTRTPGALIGAMAGAGAAQDRATTRTAGAL